MSTCININITRTRAPNKAYAEMLRLISNRIQPTQTLPQAAPLLVSNNRPVLRGGAEAVNGNGSQGGTKGEADYVIWADSRPISQHRQSKPYCITTVIMCKTRQQDREPVLELCSVGV